MLAATTVVALVVVSATVDDRLQTPSRLVAVDVVADTRLLLLTLDLADGVIEICDSVDVVVLTAAAAAAFSASRRRWATLVVGLRLLNRRALGCSDGITALCLKAPTAAVDFRVYDVIFWQQKG